MRGQKTPKVTGRQIRAALARLRGAPEPVGPDGPLHCSFCGKPDSEVDKLIAGPSVFICDQCIAKCVAILKDEESAPHPKR